MSRVMIKTVRLCLFFLLFAGCTAAEETEKAVQSTSEEYEALLIEQNRTFIQRYSQEAPDVVINDYLQLAEEKPAEALHILGNTAIQLQSGELFPFYLSGEVMVVDDDLSGDGGESNLFKAYAGKKEIPLTGVPEQDELNFLKAYPEEERYLIRVELSSVPVDLEQGDIVSVYGRTTVITAAGTTLTEAKIADFN